MAGILWEMVELEFVKCGLGGCPHLVHALAVLVGCLMRDLSVGVGQVGAVGKAWPASTRIRMIAK